jgi:formiminotetrahydrofolate cyclodeaminase
MKLTEHRVVDLVAAFRSSEPTPGGGSASALAGAVGAALLAMVAGLPKPKAQEDDDLLELRTAGERCAQLSEQLTALVDRDSDAYQLVVRAYRLPKATDDEKRARGEQIQRAMRAAIEAPLEVMRGCREGLSHSGVVAGFGNANASSDVQVAITLLRAGLRGARLNVEINLDSVKDAAYVDAVRTEVAHLDADA